MNLVKLAHQEILEVVLDLDEVISNIEQGTYDEEFVEVESENFIFYVTLDIKGKVNGSYAGWSDHQDPYFKEFSGEIIPATIEAYHVDSSEQFELKMTNQIRTQLKTSR